MDAQDNAFLRKTQRWDAVPQFLAGLPHCAVGMEACSGAHCWAKLLSDHGHGVRLISPQFVTPYVESNKNDRNNAEAVCEAVGRPSMRFAPPKSAQQLDIQAVHRIRQRLASDRARRVNQVRGRLAKHGVVIPRDIARLQRAVSQIAERVDDGFSDMRRHLVRDVSEESAEADHRTASYATGTGPLARK